MPGGHGFVGVGIGRRPSADSEDWTIVRSPEGEMVPGGLPAPPLPLPMGRKHHGVYAPMGIPGGSRSKLMLRGVKEKGKSKEKGKEKTRESGKGKGKEARERQRPRSMAALMSRSASVPSGGGGGYGLNIEGATSSEDDDDDDDDDLDLDLDLEDEEGLAAGRRKRKYLSRFSYGYENDDDYANSSAEFGHGGYGNEYDASLAGVHTRYGRAVDPKIRVVINESARFVPEPVAKARSRERSDVDGGDEDVDVDVDDGRWLGPDEDDEGEKKDPEMDFGFTVEGVVNDFSGEKERREKERERIQRASGMSPGSAYGHHVSASSSTTGSLNGGGGRSVSVASGLWYSLHAAGFGGAGLPAGNGRGDSWGRGDSFDYDDPSFQSFDLEDEEQEGEDEDEDALDSDPCTFGARPRRRRAGRRGARSSGAEDDGEVSPTIPSFSVDEVVNNFKPVVRKPPSKGLLRSPVSAGALGMFGGRGSPFGGMSFFTFLFIYSQN